MTLVEFYTASQQALRRHLASEKQRLETAIRTAAAAGDMAQVGRLQPQLDDVDGDLDLLDADTLAAAVSARLQLPQLPPDFKDIIRRGQADVANWQKLQDVAQRTIAAAGDVAGGVSTVAQLALKYGKFLV